MIVPFPANSPFVHRVAPGLGYTKGVLRQRQTPTSAIVVHTTGAGPVTRFQDESQRARHGWHSTMDAAVWIYQTIMDFSGHYILDGETGEVVQTVPEAVVAEHVGSSHYRAYKAGGWGSIDTAWWPVRWQGKKSPLELAGGKLWTGGTCNGNTIGIEVVPRAAGPRGPWSPKAWGSLIALIRDVGARHGVPVDRQHVVTHSDASPLSRSANGFPWDPGPHQWTPELFESHGL